MTLSELVVTGILAIFGGAGASLVAGLLAKPKTKAEARQLQKAGEVAVSAEAREWARDFARRTEHAEQRAVAADQRAEAAEHRAETAEQRAEVRCDELESSLIECYGYVRLLREQIRHLGEQPPPLPVRLEALWRATGS